VTVTINMKITMEHAAELHRRLIEIRRKHPKVTLQQVARACIEAALAGDRASLAALAVADSIRVGRPSGRAS
jgi:hypothetical protein